MPNQNPTFADHIPRGVSETVWIAME